MARQQKRKHRCMHSFIEYTRIDERDFHGLELSLAVLSDKFVSMAVRSRWS
jgi:hypothetical protein